NILTDEKYLILDLVHYHTYDGIEIGTDPHGLPEVDSKTQTTDNLTLNNTEDTRGQRNKSSPDSRKLVRPGHVYPFEYACAKPTDHEIDANSVKKWFEEIVVNSLTKKKLKDHII